jgi:hypothetical protein
MVTFIFILEGFCSNKAFSDQNLGVPTETKESNVFGIDVCGRSQHTFGDLRAHITCNQGGLWKTTG